MAQFHIGQGWDVHRLCPGDRLRLGGLDLPFDRALLAHSDGDVLCHAVIDALLGAAALGDVGRLFPDTDPAYENADSLALLARTADLLRAEGWRVVNVDSTLILDRPKLAPFIGQMAENLARTLEIAPTAVSVKAKTTEGLPALGCDLFVQAQAIALIERIDSETKG